MLREGPERESFPKKGIEPIDGVGGGAFVFWMSFGTISKQAIISVELSL